MLNSRAIKSGLLLAGAGAAALSVTQPALAQESEVEGSAEMTEGEKRLSDMLEGRVAGEPRNCIRVTPNSRVTIIDDTAMVYGQGNTIYVQYTRDPKAIDDRDTLVSHRFSATQVCRQDIVTKVDPFTGVFQGTVFFDKFIPYTRVKESQAS